MPLRLVPMDFFAMVHDYQGILFQYNLMHLVNWTCSTSNWKCVRGVWKCGCSTLNLEREVNTSNEPTCKCVRLTWTSMTNLGPTTTTTTFRTNHPTCILGYNACHDSYLMKKWVFIVSLCFMAKTLVIFSWICRKCSLLSYSNLWALVITSHFSTSKKIVNTK